MKKQSIQIRDKRQSGYYQLDTALVKGGWGKALGPYGIAVYNVLACFADNDSQAAYPMYQTMADLVGCSRRKVIQVIATLERFNLIKKEKRGHGHDQTSNNFILVHRDLWVPPAQAQESQGESAAPTPTPSAPAAPPSGESPAPELTPASLTNPNLKEGAADAPRAPGCKKSKTRTPKHPAIERYRSVTGRFPPQATEPLIVEAGIESESDLTFWAEVIRHYIGCGWNPQSITGMLDHYQRRELPTTRPKHLAAKGRSNETNQPDTTQTNRRVATLDDFDFAPPPDHDR